LTIDSPALPPDKAHCKFLGESNPTTLEIVHKNFFPSRFTILRIEIVNVYQYGQLQGEKICDITIFTIVTILSSIGCHITCINLKLQNFKVQIELAWKFGLRA